MAILDKFEVRIRVNGERLREYDSENEQDDRNEVHDSSGDDTMKTSKFIEVQDGQEFEIECRSKAGYRLPRDTTELAWYTYIDGDYVRGTIMNTDFRRNTVKTHFLVAGVNFDRQGVSYEQNFKFNTLEISEENITGTLDQLKEFNKKGTIQILVWAFHTQRRDAERHNKRPRDSQPLPEKATKGRGVTLGVGYGEEKVVQKRDSHIGKHLGSAPIASFVFEYRTRRALQDLLVIERTPTPSPPVALEERDPETLTPAEVKELMEQLRAERSTKKESSGVKREREVSPIRDGELEIQQVKKAKQSNESDPIVLD